MQLHARARSRLHRRRGHTLWEVLVALTLLAAVAGIVGLAVPTRPRARADDAAREVALLLARARLTALERAATVDVVIEPSTARVWTLASGSDGPRMLASGTLELGAGTRLHAGAARARFSFDGAGLASGGPLEVRARDAGWVVSVDPWSGVASVSPR